MRYELPSSCERLPGICEIGLLRLWAGRPGGDCLFIPVNLLCFEL